MPTQDVMVEDVFDEQPLAQIMHETEKTKTFDAVAVFASAGTSPPEVSGHLPYFANEHITESTSTDQINVVYSKQFDNDELEVVYEERDDASALEDRKLKSRPQVI